MSTSESTLNLGSIILCGGRSERMGCDKSQLEFRGATLLENVIRQVVNITAPVVVVGSNSEVVKTEYPQLILLQDQIHGCGPLEGIRVGMRALESTVDYALVVACDNPLISAEVIELLFRKAQNADGSVAMIDGQIRSIPGIYRVTCYPIIESLMARHQRAVKQLAANLKMNWIEEKELRSVDSNLSSFFNVNSPADYQQLLDMQ